MWFGERHPFPERRSPTRLSASGQQRYEGWQCRARNKKKPGRPKKKLTIWTQLYSMRKQKQFYDYIQFEFIIRTSNRNNGGGRLKTTEGTSWNFLALWLVPRLLTLNSSFKRLCLIFECCHKVFTWATWQHCWISICFMHLTLKMMASKWLFELCEQSFETRRETVLGLRCYIAENERK